MWLCEKLCSSWYGGGMHCCREIRRRYQGCGVSMLLSSCVRQHFLRRQEETSVHETLKRRARSALSRSDWKSRDLIQACDFFIDQKDFGFEMRRWREVRRRCQCCGLSLFLSLLVSHLDSFWRGSENDGQNRIDWSAVRETREVVSMLIASTRPKCARLGK